jgi:hypothetical protein
VLYGPIKHTRVHRGMARFPRHYQRASTTLKGGRRSTLQLYHTPEEEYKVALGERFIDPSPEWRDVLASRRFMDQKDGTPVSV